MTLLMSSSQGWTQEQKWNTWGCPALIPGTLLSVLTGNLPLVLGLPPSHKKCPSGAGLSLELWQPPLLRLPALCSASPNLYQARLPKTQRLQVSVPNPDPDGLGLVLRGFHRMAPPGGPTLCLPLLHILHLSGPTPCCERTMLIPASSMAPTEKVFPRPLSAWTYGWDVWKW